MVWHPRSSEMSTALLSVRVGSACNVNSHLLGPVQLGPAQLGLQCEWALNLGTRWRWVVNFTPWPLYLRKEPQYSLNRRLGGSKSQSWQFGEGNNLLLLHRGKPKYKDKKLSQCHFICHKSHMTDLGLKQGFCGDSPSTNCPSHGKTWYSITKQPNNWTIKYSCKKK